MRYLRVPLERARVLLVVRVPQLRITALGIAAIKVIKD